MRLPWGALAAGATGKALEALTLAGLVLLVPRALGPADYGGFAVALAVATGIATATGIGGPALFARVLAPLHGEERRAAARALALRVARTRGLLLAGLVVAAALVAMLAPGQLRTTHVVLVGVAAVLGSAATLLAQLALGLQRTTAWSLRYPLENAVIVGAALVLYARAGLGGALAAIALGAAAALALGAASARPALRGAARGAALPAGALRFARLQAAGGTLTQVVHRGAAPACALAGAGAVATGHAAIAASVALAITYVVLQAVLAALPAASRAFASDRHGAEAMLRRTAQLCAVAVLPGCALLALAAQPLLVAALGEGFRDAAPVLRVALAAAALAPLWVLGTQLAALRGRADAVLAGAGAGALTFVAVAALALPGGAARGALVAMLAGVGVATAATFAWLRVRA